MTEIDPLLDFFRSLSWYYDAALSRFYLYHNYHQMFNDDDTWLRTMSSPVSINIRLLPDWSRYLYKNLCKSLRMRDFVFV